jgi:hypothetical protein
MPTDSKLVITFPSSITLVDDAACTLLVGTTLSPTGCSVSSNVLTLTNPFGSGSFAKGGASFSFTFSSGGTNPDSVLDAGSFTVQTWATISGTDYAIDEQIFTNVYTPKAEELTATIKDVSSFVTSA